MNHMGTQTIETEKLLLRKFELTDAQAMFRNWASDDEVTKYLTWPTHGSVDVSAMIISQWVNSYKEPTVYQWAITLKEDRNNPIGTISIVHINDRVSSVSIGYCIGQEWWNQGIMSEALRGVIRYLFEIIGVNRIEAVHDVNNLASGIVMKKAGMTYEGILRKADRNNQGITDICSYSILKEEYFG